MSPNIKGVPFAVPGTYAEGEVVSSGLSIPANNRALCILGEGQRHETIVNFAQGRGKDGFDPTFTTTLSGTDSRHFRLSKYPLVENRTTLYKNSSPLVGKEETISTSTTLDPKYDYRVDPLLGTIELQGAHIKDQGGMLYKTSNTSITGNLSSSDPSIAVELIDASAPSETWTIRCSSVRRDINGDPIDGYGKFVVSGSVSGIISDAYGAPIVWQSDSIIRNNGILRFAINEGLTPFNVNDTFTVIVVSGALSNGDNLVAEYICELDLNDMEFFTDLEAVAAKHGIESTSNTITIGAKLALTNGAPGLYCMQAKPSMPRRLFYTIMETGTGKHAVVDDLKFALPLGVKPDSNSEVKFFLVDSTTGAETQFLPNKHTFYDPSLNEHNFVFSGSSYSYTVTEENATIISGEDLAVVHGVRTSTLSSVSDTFDNSYIGLSVRIIGSSLSNDGLYTITGISNGNIVISTSLVSETGLTFRIEDSSETSCYILLSQDLYLTTTNGLKVGVVDYKDASFFDAGWTTALEKLESYEFDMLVPLPTQTISAIIQASLQHCITMSYIKNRKERVLLTGAIQGLLPKNITGDSLAAVENLGILEGIQGDDPLEIYAGEIEDLANYSVSNSFGNTYRCMYFYPDKIVITINGNNTFMSGMYMAAAGGGWFAGNGDLSMPLTNKTLTGFTILNDRTYSTTVVENLARAGVCLVQPILGGGNVLWGRTTSQSGYPEEEEMSIVFIRDAVCKRSRLATASFIGQPETPSFASSLQTRMVSFLNALSQQGLITAFSNVLVVRDSVEPRQWNISFKIQPTYPINWIYIKFSLGVI